MQAYAWALVNNNAQITVPNLQDSQFGREPRHIRTVVNMVRDKESQNRIHTVFAHTDCTGIGSLAFEFLTVFHHCFKFGQRMN